MKIMYRRCSVCGESAFLKTRKDHESWDWFTGYLPKTAVFCPDHKNSRERHAAYEVSRIKPEIEENKKGPPQ